MAHITDTLPVEGCSGCATSGGRVACPTHGGGTYGTPRPLDWPPEPRDWPLGPNVRAAMGMAPAGFCSCPPEGASPACPLHGGEAIIQPAQRPWSPGETMGMILHQHVWRYDGTAADGQLIYHCDAHDPPVVRMARVSR